MLIRADQIRAIDIEHGYISSVLKIQNETKNIFKVIAVSIGKYVYLFGPDTDAFVELLQEELEDVVTVVPKEAQIEHTKWLISTGVDLYKHAKKIWG